MELQQPHPTGMRRILVLVGVEPMVLRPHQLARRRLLVTIPSIGVHILPQGLIVHIIPTLVALLHLVPRHRALNTHKLPTLEIPNRHPRIGKEVIWAHIVDTIPLISLHLSAHLGHLPRHGVQLEAPILYPLILPPLPNNPHSILSGIIKPKVVWRQHSGDIHLILDKSFHRLDLHLPSTVSPSELMDRIPPEQHTGPISVGRHHQGVSVWELNGRVDRFPGVVALKSALRVKRTLMEIGHHLILGLHPRFPSVALLRPRELHSLANPIDQPLVDFTLKGNIERRHYGHPHAGSNFSPSTSPAPSPRSSSSRNGFIATVNAILTASNTSSCSTLG